MQGFRLPTQIHIEPGCLARLPEALMADGISSILLVLDKGLAATDWPRTTRASLKQAGITVESFDEVDVNPRTGTAERAGALVREKGLEAVVSLGGGSVLDAGKAAAMLATNPGAALDYEGKNMFSAPPLPFYAIPSTCGTGSEVTWVSVLTHEVSQRKISVKGDAMFPNRALVDADLLATLPQRLVAWTGMDAFTHALEATTCKLANPVSNALAEKAIALLFAHLPAAAADPATNSAAREAVMRAATLAGMAFGNADVAGVHCLSETLGARYDTPHGLANAILLTPVMRYHAAFIETRLDQLATLYWPGDTNPGAGAPLFLEKLQALATTLAIPDFSSLAIDSADLPAIAAQAATNGSNDSNPQAMTASNYLEILQAM